MWMPRLITLLFYCPFDFKALTEKFLLCCRWKELLVWQECHGHQISYNSNCLLVHQKRGVVGIRPFYQMLWQETHLMTVFPSTQSLLSASIRHMKYLFNHWHSKEYCETFTDNLKIMIERSSRLLALKFWICFSHWKDVCHFKVYY